MTDILKDKQVSPEMQEVIDYEAKEIAKASVIKAGLLRIGKPAIPTLMTNGAGEVTLPPDITILSDTELGQYISIFTGLSTYAEGVVAMADIDWVTSLRIAEFAERIEMLSLPKEQQKNDDFRYGAVHSIKYVRDLRRKELEAQSIYKLSASMLRSYEKAVASLSREISRRANMNTIDRYEENLDRRMKGGTNKGNSD